MRPYDEATHQRWVAKLADLIDHDAPDGLHRPVDRAVDRIWPSGVYVATSAGLVEYVGSVCRTVEDGFDARFAEHHQPVETWEQIWLLPFRRDVGVVLVRWAEARMIAALRPRSNVVRPDPWIIGRRVLSRG